MIRQFRFNGSLLECCSPADAKPTSAPIVWIDLLNPTSAEIEEVDKNFAIDLPTLEEMREIEISSRLYEEGSGYYMTIIYVADALGENPETSPLTFVLKDGILVTVRYRDMRIVEHFINKTETRGLIGSQSNTGLMLTLLESVVDLCADALEKNHLDIETESRKVFDLSLDKKDYQQALKHIARVNELNSKMRESLVSQSRLHIFMSHTLKTLNVHEDSVGKLHTLTADIRSLLDDAAFTAGKASFLLDATLGMVSLEQNAIIKIFSVAAVIFLPPTLVASIYGMNFKHMPELDWAVGYPVAIILMIASALLPYYYFKHRRWL
jgi:magnesium transporter